MFLVKVFFIIKKCKILYIESLQISQKNNLSTKMYLYKIAYWSLIHIFQLQKLIILYLVYIYYNFLYEYFLFKLKILIQEQIWHPNDFMGGWWHANA